MSKSRLLMPILPAVTYVAVLSVASGEVPGLYLGVDGMRTIKATICGLFSSIWIHL